MPTPVTTARQCLTEEAGRALDDAVSVAKRRSHAQTTSLHAISALLSPSFSLLRDSLTRSRSSSYSPRLQFRALELCVGVSLDRLTPSKSPNDDFAPPVSNSLMAAIKRSQANQRRQPDIYHLNQISNANTNNSNNPISIAMVKVELKHFVLSILDDPIVSRVFAEAGFRSNEIKLAIVHPPSNRFGVGIGNVRCPPVFLCNFMDFNNGFGFGDENCRRIGEIMVKKREKNPLLVGICAKDAFFRVKDCLEKERFDFFPREIHGVKFVCLESEILGKDGLDFKFNEVGSILEECCSSSKPGLVISFGELKVLVDESDDFVKELVLRLSKLVEVYGNKLWLIGTAANYETYSNFVARFPSVEKDWDLNPLPITSSKSSFDGIGSKSSLMGSFVPFGGFFPTPSDFKPPLTAMKQPFTRCNSCNEMYERELGSLLREGSSVSVSDKYSASLPSWLQTAESDSNKGVDVVAQVKDIKATSNEKIAGLQKKWDDHCQHLHQNLTFSAPGVSLARPHPLAPHKLGFHYVSDKQGGSSSSSGDTTSKSLTEGACSNSSSGLQVVARHMPPQPKVMTVDYPRRVADISESHSSGRESPTSFGYPIPIGSLTLPRDHKLPSSGPVTTDLGLGMIYASKQNELKKPFLQDYQAQLQHFRGSVTCSQGLIIEKHSKQPIPSSFLGGSGFREGLNPGDYKPIRQKLSEVVAWQCEAVSEISQIVSCCRSGLRFTNVRGGVWLSFLGPDKVGKRKVAEALADSVFGSRNHLVAVDLGSQDRSSKVDSPFICQGSHNFDINESRMTVADHIAQELSKKPNSVVFLENIDEADLLVRNSLSRAIQTGKFQDSRGRELSIKNVIFVATSTTTKDDKTPSPRKEFIKFTEETILEAKNWEMKIEIRTVSGEASTSDRTRVSLVSPKRALKQGMLSKRKAIDISDTFDHLDVGKKPIKTPKNSLDLNLPLDEAQEASEPDSYDDDFLSDGSRVWLEDFFAQTDGNVVFKPFDFDAQADKLLRKIRLKFEEVLKGERMSLEIEYEVMVQILAAVWCSDNKRAIEDWIEQVLVASFVETRERYHLTPETVVSLVSYVGVPLKNERAFGICLPKRINLSV